MQWKTDTMFFFLMFSKLCYISQWRTENGGLGGSNPPPPLEIPKALQNRAKFNPIVKTVKNCWI